MRGKGLVIDMLEIRNVTKIYRSKTGTEVKALDGVSLTFPENGMVFILGKSGSGKSTLLNVIGGLDGADGGEFIIKGKSSKEFVGSDFDAYRNTFIGFIFQEYNILDDFTVGANIALALELQGKKATNEQINAILSEVDLLDYAKRKPNELSGGQKQRVAIARALVKNPEIIMADEPTGALDSNTGKQIFDTLKELSKNKLVIIVSHDRDFAERYGDRIIEMKDGKIESDHTKHERTAEALSEGVTLVNDGILKIKSGYELTAKDLSLINTYLKNQSADVFVSGDGRVNNSIRTAAGITAEGRASSFDKTDEEKDVRVKEYAKGESRFIRSRLPMKNALKIGAGSLGHKKFRLVLTIFLSMIAFALFGFADTMGAYNKYVSATESIIDSNIKNATFTVGVRHEWDYGEESDSHYYYEDTAMNESDIKLLEEKTGLTFLPVFNGSSNTRSTISLRENMKDKNDISSGSVYTGTLSGFVAVDASIVETLGFRLTGDYPKAANEIVISELVYRQFNHTGFVDAESGAFIEKNELTLGENGEANSIIGKSIKVEMNGMSMPRVYRITGVIDTAFDYTRYESFMPSDRQSMGEEGGLLDMVLSAELSNTLNYGFHTLAFASESCMEDLLESVNFYTNSYIGTSVMGNYTPVVTFADMYGNETTLHFYRVTDDSSIASLGTVLWLDGRSGTKLADGEVLLPFSVLHNANLSTDFTERIATAIRQHYGEEGVQLFRENYDLSATLKNLVGWDNSAAQTHAAKLIFTELFGDTFGTDLADSVYDRAIYELPCYRDENGVTITVDTVRTIMIYCREGVGGEVIHDEKMYTEAIKLFFELSDDAGASLAEVVSSLELMTYTWDPRTGSENKNTMSGYTVVGFYEGVAGENPFVSNTFYQEYVDYCRKEGWGIETVYPHETGKYAFVIAPMPSDSDTIRKLVELSYDESAGLKFEMQNMVMDTLSSFNEFIEIGAVIFLWVGVGFAVFSALMLMNFISISISYKRREIGILRAVGARSSDVFKIFFSEAAIIALINCVLSVALTLTGVLLTNHFMRSEGINVTLLTFGVRQVALMLLVSIAVAAVASFLPVYNIARKKPVDAIKNK